MAHDHSYRITLSNNRTEKAAIDYLLSVEPRYWVPDSSSRKHILAALGLPTTFSRAFDLLRVEGALADSGDLQLADMDRITLIELKTTKKRLADLPRGFFFGATANEFELAKRMGSRFRFCFVCLHPDSLGHLELSLAELEPLIKTKRTQYQINL